jgi:hypothetical protein
VVTPKSAVIEFCVDIASDVGHRDMQRMGDNKRYEDILLYIKRWTKKCKEEVAGKSRE